MWLRTVHCNMVWNAVLHASAHARTSICQEIHNGLPNHATCRLRAGYVIYSYLASAGLVKKPKKKAAPVAVQRTVGENDQSEWLKGTAYDQYQVCTGVSIGFTGAVKLRLQQAG